MSNRSKAVVASCLLFSVLFSSGFASSMEKFDGLQRPTRPDHFSSPEEVAQYVKNVHEYIRAMSIRYGKRFAPTPDDGAQTPDLSAIEEENPQEQLALQQGRATEEDDASLYRLLAQIPLPLLAKYLRINQIASVDDGVAEQRGGEGQGPRRTMVHPFVRQRFISSKQRISPNPNNHPF